MNKKEEIIFATLELAAEYGLKSVSMAQIAEKVGIKKPSLYNHFKSKEVLVEEMYQYLRDKSRESVSIETFDYSEYIKGKSVKEILNQTVENYKKMVTDEKMLIFYKVIYSERSINPFAAKILADETKRMILATKSLFYALQVHKKIFVDNIDIAAISYAMTIHSIIDYQLDCIQSNEDFEKDMIEKYIEWFSNQYSLNNEEE